MLDADTCYRAYTARDARFDGTFFVGVRTTGIYCRPTCPARVPRRDRCVFYEHPAEAERAGFRACFRCRPERAPGTAPAEAVARLVQQAVSRIEAGYLNEHSVEELACELDVTDRHLRRAMEADLGVTPVELAQSRRLALAQQLVRDSSLPLIDVALASGFSSVRRFNALYRQRFGKPPSEMRRTLPGAGARHGVVFQLEYRPPFDWEELLSFLAMRAIPGVESIVAGEYRRTVVLGTRTGWISVRNVPVSHALAVEVAPSLIGSLMLLFARVRGLFDLNAHPAVVAEQLGRDRLFRTSLRRRPGLRIPGAFDGFETAVRAILGQQVSVRGATTLSGRLAKLLGTRCETPFPELDTAFPAAARVAEAEERQIASIGLPGARARALRELAAAVAKGELRLERGVAVEEGTARLKRLPGIGEWTAQYLAMRVFGWPDAFPASDLGIRKALGDLSPAAIEARAARWRPWRAYAAMHLWATLSEGDRQ